MVGKIDPSRIKAHPRVVSFYRALGEERAKKQADDAGRK